MPKYLRVVEKGDKWSVQLEGEELSVHDTQAEAEEVGRARAKQEGAEFEPPKGGGQGRGKDA